MKHVLRFLFIFALLVFTAHQLDALTIIDANAPQEQQDNREEFFNIDEEEPLTHETFRKLYHAHKKKQKRKKQTTWLPYVIAQIETKADDKTFYHFYDASELGRFFAKTLLDLNNLDDLSRDRLNPCNNLKPIAMRLYEIASLAHNEQAKLTHEVKPRRVGSLESVLVWSFEEIDTRFLLLILAFKIYVLFLHARVKFANPDCFAQLPATNYTPYDQMKICCPLTRPYGGCFPFSLK